MAALCSISLELLRAVWHFAIYQLLQRGSVIGLIPCHGRSGALHSPSQISRVRHPFPFVERIRIGIEPRLFSQILLQSFLRIGERPTPLCDHLAEHLDFVRVSILWVIVPIVFLHWVNAPWTVKVRPVLCSTGRWLRAL